MLSFSGIGFPKLEKNKVKSHASLISQFHPHLRGRSACARERPRARVYRTMPVRCTSTLRRFSSAVQDLRGCVEVGSAAENRVHLNMPPGFRLTASLKRLNSHTTLRLNTHTSIPLARALEVQARGCSVYRCGKSAQLNNNSARLRLERGAQRAPQGPHSAPRGSKCDGACVQNFCFSTGLTFRFFFFPTEDRLG